MSPFDLLPVETIASIFHYVVSRPRAALDDAYDTRSDQLAITATCRRWRGIAISEPSLWTTIYIVLPCPDEHTAIIEQVCQRSAGRPLSVYVATKEEHGSSEDGYHSVPNPKICSLVHRHLIPHAEFLWLDAAFSTCDSEGEEDSEGIADWFPLQLPHNHKLHTLHIGDKACPEVDDEDDFQLFSKTLTPSLNNIHISTYSVIIPSLTEASPLKLVIDILGADEIDPQALDDFGLLPRLEELSLTCDLPPSDFEPELSSTSLRHLDIFLPHNSAFPEREILILSQLLSLESLIIRVGPGPRETDFLSDDEFEEQGAPPQLPALRKLVVKPSIPHFEVYGFRYQPCNCLGAFLQRTNALVMLDVHHGHALGALESLLSSYDACSSLECVRTTAVEHTSLLGTNEIIRMASELALSRPNLQMLWAESSPGDPLMVAVELLSNHDTDDWTTEEGADSSESEDEDELKG